MVIKTANIKQIICKHYLPDHKLMTSRTGYNQFPSSQMCSCYASRSCKCLNVYNTLFITFIMDYASISRFNMPNKRWTLIQAFHSINRRHDTRFLRMDITFYRKNANKRPRRVFEHFTKKPRCLIETRRLLGIRRLLEVLRYKFNGSKGKCPKPH